MAHEVEVLRLDSSESAGCSFARVCNGRAIEQPAIGRRIVFPYGNCVNPEKCRCKWVPVEGATP